MNRFMTNSLSEKQAFEWLATLLFAGTGSRDAFVRFGNVLEAVWGMNEEGLKALLAYAEVQRVQGRVLSVLENHLPECAAGAVRDSLTLHSARESQRAEKVLASGNLILEAFERHGLPVVIMKTLDHWPDTGSDVDLLTPASDEEVRAVFAEFSAVQQPPSLGDRLAHKFNFRLPDLAELVEVHVGCLGQTGEHQSLAREVVSRHQWKPFGRHCLPVPSHEDQVAIATLQRMYRHFYIRLTDIVNIYGLLAENELHFARLESISKAAGIWPGVATVICVSHAHAVSYGAAPIEIPQQVRAAVRFDVNRTHLDRRFVRVPLVPEAAKLYLHQLAGNGKRGDLRAFTRLSMLPLLAAAAYVSFRITGDDKGVW